MAVEETLQYLAQQGGGQGVLFETLQGQVQPRHMNAPRLCVIEADTCIRARSQTLAIQDDRNSDPAHAHPIQRQGLA
mgnify:CR=1 FL=1